MKKMSRKLASLVLAYCGCLIISLSFIGCAVEYYAPGPPPEERVEAVGIAPGPDYVWINGYWWWENNNWAWREGRWAVRPHEGAMWERHTWERRGDRYYYREGHWR